MTAPERVYRFRYEQHDRSIANPLVTLDGEDIGNTISSVRFEHTIGEFPTVFLTLLMPGVVIETEGRVKLRPEDEAALRLLGWEKKPFTNQQQETEQ